MLIEKLKAGLFWLVGLKFLAQVISWAATFYVIRQLSPTDFAIVEIAAVIVYVAMQLSAGGMSLTIIRFNITDNQQLAQIFTYCAISYLVLFSMVFFSAELIDAFYQFEGLGTLLQFSSLILLLGPFKLIALSQLNRDLRFKEIAIVNMVSSLLSVATTLVVLYIEPSYWALAVSTLVSELCITFGALVYAKHKFVLTRNFSGFSSLFKDTSVRLLNSLLSSISSVLDRLLIGKLTNSTMLGEYVVSKRLAEMLYDKVAAPLNQISFAGYSKSNQTKGLSEKYLIKSMGHSAFITFPIFWGLSSIGEYLIPVILGDEWQQVHFMFAVLCLSIPLRFMAANIQSFIGAVYNPLFNTLSQLVLIAFCILALSIAYPYGGDGIAISLVVAIFMHFCFYIFLLKVSLHITITPLLKIIITPLIHTMIMFAVVKIVIMWASFYLSELACISIAIIIGVLTYLLASYVFNKQQVDEIKSLMLRRSA